jgi:hypothetical protein
MTAETAAPDVRDGKDGRASNCLRIFGLNAEETGRTRLRGQPVSLGVTPDSYGVRRAGITLARVADGAIVIDSPDPGWWDELIAAAQAARDELVYGGFRAAAAHGAQGGER